LHIMGVMKFSRSRMNFEGPGGSGGSVQLDIFMIKGFFGARCADFCTEKTLLENEAPRRIGSDARGLTRTAGCL